MNPLVVIHCAKASSPNENQLFLSEKLHRTSHPMALSSKPTQAMARKSAAMNKSNNRRQVARDSSAADKASGTEMNGAVSGEHVFRLAIDYGTTKIAAAWQICNEDSTSIMGPFDVRFANGELKAPNIAAYDNGHFLWGKDLAQRLEVGDISETRVIRFAKLAIFPDPQTVEFKEQVDHKLGRANKTIHELVEDGLRAVIEHAKNHAAETVEGSEFNVMAMRLELFLSVPQSEYWLLTRDQS